MGNVRKSSPLPRRGTLAIATGVLSCLMIHPLSDTVIRESRSSMLICCLHLTVRATILPQSHLHRLANSSSSHSLIIIFVSLMLTQTWMSLLLPYWMVPDLRLHFQRMDLQSYLP